jgi:L-asparaginase II
MTAEPFMLAGHGRFCTEVATVGGGAVVAKTGAEGVFALAIPAKGLGLAVKIDDGATRSAEVVAARLLADHVGDEGLRETFLALAGRPVHNVAGREVGQVRAAM